MSSTSTSGGVSGAFLLFLVFLVLKLTGVISWSWWWVTCPLWAGLALGLGIMLIAFIISVCTIGIAALLNK